MSDKRTLSVCVVKARDLAAKDSSGKSDPYVKVKVAGIKKKTKTVKQNLNPEWGETFYFDDVDDRVAVHLVMYDWDLVGGHDFMGEITIPSADIADAAKATVEKWYPLQKKKAKETVTGDLYVKLSLMEKPSASFDPKAAMATMGVEGHPAAPTGPVTAPAHDNTSVPPPAFGGPAPPPPPPVGAPRPPAPSAVPPPPSGGAPPPPPPPGAAPPPPQRMPQPLGGAPHPPAPTGPPQPPHGGLPPALPPKRNLPAAPSMVTNQPGGLHQSQTGYAAPPMHQPVQHSDSGVFAHPPADSPPQPPMPKLPPRGPPPAPVRAVAPQVRIEYDFDAMNPNEISAKAGEIMTLLEENGEWTKVASADGRDGWIASNYVTKL